MASGAHKNYALIYSRGSRAIYFYATSATPAQAEQRGAAEVVGSSWRTSRGHTEGTISQRLSRAQKGGPRDRLAKELINTFHVSTGTTCLSFVDSPGAAERVCSGTAQLGKHSSGLATMTTRHLQLRWSANGGNALAA